MRQDPSDRPLRELRRRLISAHVRRLEGNRWVGLPTGVSDAISQLSEAVASRCQGERLPPDVHLV